MASSRGTDPTFASLKRTLTALEASVDRLEAEITEMNPPPTPLEEEQDEEEADDAG